MYVLQSTGMIAVELEFFSAQSLQLATGKTAVVKMPIPTSLLAKAPPTINTWSLNEQGIWVKEGTATSFTTNRNGVAGCTFEIVSTPHKQMISAVLKKSRGFFIVNNLRKSM